MSAVDPLDAVRAFYAHVLAGEVAQAEALMHDDFQSSQPASLPFGGRHVGRAGFWSFMESFSSYMVDVESDIVSLAADGPTVFALLDVSGRAAASGAQIQTQIAEVIDVADGRLRSIRAFFWDPAALTVELASPLAELDRSALNAEPIGDEPK